MRIRLDLSYVGTRYVGWQRQPNGPSVQAVLEEILGDLYDRRVTVGGAGRTDAGVHAENQVAHFDIQKNRPKIEDLASILNRLLPNDIVVRRATKVSNRFHSRHDAIRRTYRYRILFSKIPDPFRAPCVWHWPPAAKLNVAKMRREARRWIGAHDFSMFAIRLDKDESAKRNMKKIQIRKSGDELHFVFTADAFLHRMVRRMVVYFADIGSGLNVTQPRFAAPASGLCLMNVAYR